MEFQESLNTIIYVGAMVASVAVTLIAILTYFRKGKLRAGRFMVDFKKDIESVVKEVEEAIPEEVSKKPPEERQFLLLRQYHSQGLAQSKISFWFSLIFASLGFVVIIIAILMMDKEAKLTEQGRAFIPLIAGTIIDAVAALFFIQSNKARRLMTEFFDKLRTDRKFEESLQLADQIPDKTLQSRLKIMLAMSFAEVKSTDGVLSSMFNIKQQPNKRNEMKKEKSVEAKKGKSEKKQSK